VIEGSITGQRALVVKIEPSWKARGQTNAKETTRTGPLKVKPTAGEGSNRQIRSQPPRNHDVSEMDAFTAGGSGIHNL
jgi:hypothetical protein